jgi:hypothetical protein
MRNLIQFIAVIQLLYAVHATETWLSNAKQLIAANPIQSSTTSKEETSLQEDERDVESTIQSFLSSHPSKADKFYIQGWRWHTLSLIRDSRRLEKYAIGVFQDSTSCTRDKLDSLQKAADHVINFNLKGLQRIENDVFFPWLREKLINKDMDSNTKKAFQNVMDGVDRDRKQVEEIALSIMLEIKVATDPKSDAIAVETAKTELIRKSDLLSSMTASIMNREDRFLVPGVMRVVPSNEQKSFNNKVLRNLGIFESRKHLIGMYDAVHDSMYGNEEEQLMFVEQIPSVARLMIGRWRRTLYDPAAGMLDES